MMIYVNSRTAYSAVSSLPWPNTLVVTARLKVIYGRDHSDHTGGAALVLIDDDGRGRTHKGYNRIYTPNCQHCTLELIKNMLLI